MRLVGGELDDAVPQPDVLRPLARRAEEDLRRRGVRILLQEVMLHLPGIVVAEPVGELDLGERVLEELILATLLPRPRELMFVGDAELHGASASWPLSDTAPGQSSRRRMCGQLHQPSIRNEIRDIGTIAAAITRIRACEKRTAQAP